MPVFQLACNDAENRCTSRISHVLIMHTGYIRFYRRHICIQLNNREKLKGRRLSVICHSLYKYLFHKSVYFRRINRVANCIEKFHLLLY